MLVTGFHACRDAKQIRPSKRSNIFIACRRASSAGFWKRRQTHVAAGVDECESSHVIWFKRIMDWTSTRLPTLQTADVVFSGRAAESGAAHVSPCRRRGGTPPPTPRHCCAGLSTDKRPCCLLPLLLSAMVVASLRFVWHTIFPRKLTSQLLFFLFVWFFLRLLCVATHSLPHVCGQSGRF